MEAKTVAQIIPGLEPDHMSVTAGDPPHPVRLDPVVRGEGGHIDRVGSQQVATGPALHRHGVAIGHDAGELAAPPGHRADRTAQGDQTLVHPAAKDAMNQMEGLESVVRQTHQGALVVEGAQSGFHPGELLLGIGALLGGPDLGRSNQQTGQEETEQPPHRVLRAHRARRSSHRAAPP